MSHQPLLDVCRHAAAPPAALPASAETVEAIGRARLSATRALQLGAGDVLVLDNYKCVPCPQGAYVFLGGEEGRRQRALFPPTHKKLVCLVAISNCCTHPRGIMCACLSLPVLPWQDGAWAAAVRHVRGPDAGGGAHFGLMIVQQACYVCFLLRAAAAAVCTLSLYMSACASGSSSSSSSIACISSCTLLHSALQNICSVTQFCCTCV